MFWDVFNAVVRIAVRFTCYAFYALLSCSGGLVAAACAREAAAPGALQAAAWGLWGACVLTGFGRAERKQEGEDEGEWDWLVEESIPTALALAFAGWLMAKHLIPAAAAVGRALKIL